MIEQVVEALKPCPFCGAAAQLHINSNAAKCPATGCTIGGMWTSIAAWNRRAEPTPEALEGFAEWFDDPNKSPALGVQVGGGRLVTPGAILREIARRLRAAREE